MCRKELLHQGGKAWGSCVSVYYVNLQFSHAYTRPFCPGKLQKITKCFQCGYKTKTKLKHITHYAIFQNRRICADRPTIWLGALCSSCILPYINGLWSALVSVAGQAVLCVFGLYGRWVRESVSVFNGFVFISVDVKYIIHYKRICKFIYSL